MDIQYSDMSNILCFDVWIIRIIQFAPKKKKKKKMVWLNPYTLELSQPSVTVLLSKWNKTDQILLPVGSFII